MKTEKLLDERKRTHGSFIVNSRVSQGLKDVIRKEPLYAELDIIHREALDHIFGKIGRIMAGDPRFIDAWRDVAGYASLIVKELEQTPGATDVEVKHIVI